MIKRYELSDNKAPYSHLLNICSVYSDYFTPKYLFLELHNIGRGFIFWIGQTLKITHYSRKSLFRFTVRANLTHEGWRRKRRYFQPYIHLYYVLQCLILDCFLSTLFNNKNLEFAIKASMECFWSEELFTWPCLPSKYCFNSPF